MKHATFAFIHDHQDNQGDATDLQQPAKGWDILAQWLGSTPCNGTFVEELTYWERNKLATGLGAENY